MNHVDADLVAGIQRFEVAIEELNRTGATEAREMVCIESRAVFSIFEEVSYWDGEVNRKAQQRLLDLFGSALELMASVKDDLLSAVQRRRDQIRDLDPKHVPLELNAN